MPPRRPPIERELKFWPVRLHELRKALEGQGGRLLFSCLVANVYFDFPGRDPDTLFRLRVAGECAELAAKGPRLAAETKARVEHETLVSDPRAASDLMAAAGARPVSREERWREEWTLPDGVKVTIDRLAPDRVPLYAEIEAPTDERIRSAASRLGLDGAESAAITFEELCTLFGISFHETAGTFPPSLRLRREPVYPACPPPAPSGKVKVSVPYLSPTGRTITVERWGRGGYALFGASRLAVAEPEALEGILAMLRCRAKGTFSE